jgi:hypothetical protein
MPNSTPEVKKDVREIYNQVPEGIRLMSEAVPYLLAILELKPSDESKGIESQRTAIDIRRISDTLTERGYGNFEQTKEYDPKSIEIARYIIDLTTRYPFLGCSKKASEEGISNKELAEELISNADTCLYSNFSGLYGITNLQGQQLRGSIQSPHDSSRLTVGDVEDLIREARQKLAAENEPERASNFGS